MASLSVVTFKSLIFAVSTAASAKSEKAIVPSSIFAEVTASFANLAVVTLASFIFVVSTALLAIFVVEIAPIATSGEVAVPVKSPANWILPFRIVVASGTPEETLASTYSLIIFTDGYLSVELASAIRSVLLLVRFSFKSKAAWVAIEMGLFASEVLSTFPKPTIVLSIPETAPVKVGDASGAFKSKAAWVAVAMGLFASEVLSTFPKPKFTLATAAVVAPVPPLARGTTPDTFSAF